MPAVGAAFVAVRCGVVLSACGWLVGESFVAVDLRNPKTGETAMCEGHIGLGSPTSAEIDAMNKCVDAHLHAGFEKI